MNSKRIRTWKVSIMMTVSLIVRADSFLAFNTRMVPSSLSDHMDNTNPFIIITNGIPSKEMITSSAWKPLKAQTNEKCSVDLHEPQVNITSEYQIRPAQQKDLLQASKLLTDAFFHNNNIVMFLIEWLKTYFSLQDGLMECKSDESIMLVACTTTHNKSMKEEVWALCEVDFRWNGKRISNNNNIQPSHPSSIVPVPYLCNLVVKPKERNKGIGKAMLYACEQQAREWQASNLYLKVRSTNTAAIDMYTRWGYQIIDIQKDSKDLWGNTIVLMTKVLL
jgi:ribosomal protein S18 acetylase RimI-like enzyme